MAKKRKASSNKAAKRDPAHVKGLDAWPVAKKGGYRTNPAYALQNPELYRWKSGTLAKAKKVAAAKAGRKRRERDPGFRSKKSPRDYIEVDRHGYMVMTGTGGFATPFKEPFKPRKGEDLRIAALRHLSVVEPKGLNARSVETRWPSEIKVGNRVRKDLGDIAELAREIDAVGLLHAIPITPKNKLIAGERRLKAWQISKFKLLPIPVKVVPLEDIERGEWSENYGRKDFTPSEAVAMMRALEPKERKRIEKRMAARPSETKPAPGRQAKAGAAGGRIKDHIAKFVGKDRRTIEKAAEVVDAAAKDPAQFGKLKADMDRTGNVSGPHKRLKVMEQTEQLRKAPPPPPMKGPYKVAVIDFPWPVDDKEQEEIDAAGRSGRGYPEMSIKSCCAFAKEQIAPVLDADVTVYLWVPNWHLVRGYAHHVIAALGFEGRGVTMITWVKDKIGRGKIVRDKTEQVIVLTRGNPVINVYGEDPPTTELRAPRRENSRKPEEFYRLVERVTPAPRYASFFSRGGEGELWDCHGDEVGKFAPKPPIDAEELAKANGTGLVETDHGAKVPPKFMTDQERIANDELSVLEAIARGERFGSPEILRKLEADGLILGNVRSKRSKTLTARGRERMEELQSGPRLTGYTEEGMRQELAALEAVERGDFDFSENAVMHTHLRAKGWVTKGGYRRKPHLSEGGKIRIGVLRHELGDDARPLESTFSGSPDHRIKGALAHVKGGHSGKVAAGAVKVIGDKARAGEIAWQKGAASGYMIGAIGRFFDGTFRNIAIVDQHVKPQVFVEAVQIRLDKKTATVEAFTDHKGDRTVGAGMPHADLTVFLHAWGKVETVSITEAAPQVSAPELEDKGPELPFGPVSHVCRVCGCTDDKKCPGGCTRIETTLCSSCAASQSHIITMHGGPVIDSDNGTNHRVVGGEAKATCSCGSFDYTGPWGEQQARERAVRSHWQDVVGSTGDEIPPGLRRRQGDGQGAST